MFDAHTLRQRRARAARRGPSFLLQRCIEDASERICDIHKPFENAVIIGPETAVAALIDQLPASKCPKRIHASDCADGLTQGPYDLIISLLRLQTSQDPVADLKPCAQALKPDGLLLACLFGGETLRELRQAFYVADEHHLGGLTPRIFPFPTHTQAASLLSAVGLALPVVDTDKVTVNYRKLRTLISDLRDLGETNSLSIRDKRPLGKAYWQTLKGGYPRRHDTGHFGANFEILWLTGWAPHARQQKPLKRGSAQVSLTDVFKHRDETTK